MRLPYVENFLSDAACHNVNAEYLIPSGIKNQAGNYCFLLVHNILTIVLLFKQTEIAYQ